jgi:hypothetical protein
MNTTLNNSKKSSKDQTQEFMVEEGAEIILKA